MKNKENKTKNFDKSKIFVKIMAGVLALLMVAGTGVTLVYALMAQPIKNAKEQEKPMVINLGMNWENFYKDNIMSYIKSLQANPLELITLLLDLAIVIFLLY